MTREEQLKIYDEMHEKITKVSASKGHDYANEDVLSNFKTISEAAKQLGIDTQSPTGYALFMVVLKLGRLGNLMASGKTPKHEAVEDTFLDGIHYFKLAYLCHKEAQKAPVEVRVDFTQLKQEALKEQNFVKAASLRDFEKRLQEVLSK